MGTKRDRSQARGWIWEAESLGHVWRMSGRCPEEQQVWGKRMLWVRQHEIEMPGGPSSEVLRRHLDIQD